MKLVYALFVATLGANPLLAQGPEKGMLLVATPEIRDSRFSETVILLLHYESEGALGVAINRPTWVDPSAAFPEMDFLQDYRGNIFVGGPVARANLLLLAKGPDIDISDTEPIFEDIYFSADSGFLRDVAATADTDQGLRLYAGHASWEAGQLDREISAGHWLVIPARSDIVFAEDPLEIWQQVSALESEMTVRLPVRESAVASLP